MIAVNRQSFAHDVSVDAVIHRDTGNRGARLQAFLDDLGFEVLWIRGSLAHGDPLGRLIMVSTLSAHHRLWVRAQEGVLAGRIP